MEMETSELIKVLSNPEKMPIGKLIEACKEAAKLLNDFYDPIQNMKPFVRVNGKSLFNEIS